MDADLSPINPYYSWLRPFSCLHSPLLFLFLTFRCCYYCCCCSCYCCLFRIVTIVIIFEFVELISHLVIAWLVLFVRVDHYRKSKTVREPRVTRHFVVKQKQSLAQIPSAFRGASSHSEYCDSNAIRKNTNSGQFCFQNSTSEKKQKWYVWLLIYVYVVLYINRWGTLRCPSSAGQLEINRAGRWPRQSFMYQLQIETRWEQHV